MNLVNKPVGNSLTRGFQAVGEVARTKDGVLGKLSLFGPASEVPVSVSAVVLSVITRRWPVSS